MGARVLWALGLALAAALARAPGLLAALAGLAVGGIVLSGKSRVLPRAVGAALMLGLVALGINVVAGWLSARGPLGGVGTARDGLLIGAWIGARLAITALAFAGLAATTRPGHALDALSAGPLRRLGRAGDGLTVVALLALRFGPLAAAEGRRLLRAVALRVDRSPGLWAAPAVTVPLVLAAVRRADRLALVLEARHFGVGPRTPPVVTPWTAGDRGLALAGLALPFAVAWLSHG